MISALSWAVYTSFKGVFSDDRIVSAKIRLSQWRNKKKKNTKTSNYDFTLLSYSDIRNQYTLTEREKFDILQKIAERHTPNDEYENFIATI